MGQYKDERVLDIIEEINDEYFLPHIQRAFVWKEEQILRLFDSLLRGYPIGTFLFWKIKDIQTRRRKFLANFYKEYNKNFNIEKLGLEDTAARKDLTLVLDGQQRLQSLYTALKGKYEDMELYFDLLSGETEDDEGILYRFDFLKKQPEKTDGNFWFKAKDLLAKITCEKLDEMDVSEELSRSVEDEKRKKTVRKSVSRFFRALAYENNLSYYSETTPAPEKIFDIFVRVNSYGTPLSKSDMLFSFIKLKWKKFEAEKAFPSLLDKINGNGQFDFDVDFILKTAVVLLGFPARYTIKTFTGQRGKEIAEKMEEKWSQITKSITSVVDLVRDEFSITDRYLLPSNNSLIPIAYYAQIKNKKSKNSFDYEDKKIIKNWLVNGLLCGAFSGHSDTILDKAKKTIDESRSKSFPAEKINAEFRALQRITQVNKDILKKIQYGDPESYLLLYLIYPFGTIFKPSSEANYPEQDHIFSDHELRSSPSHYSPNEINRIGNLRLVTRNANRRKSKTPYDKWIKSEKKEELKLTLIPGKPADWNVENYKEFVQKREEEIIKKIRE